MDRIMELLPMLSAIIYGTLFFILLVRFVVLVFFRDSLLPLLGKRLNGSLARFDKRVRSYLGHMQS